MDNQVWMRGPNRTRQRVIIPRCRMGPMSNPHLATDYKSMVDGCEALFARADGLDLAGITIQSPSQVMGRQVIPCGVTQGGRL